MNNSTPQELIQAFQLGYAQRDVTKVEAFMELFTEDAEVIGTNGQKPGVDEWYTNRDGARELVEGDWESWGDLRLDLDTANIHQNGDIAWMAATATVSKTIGKDNFQSYLDFIRDYMDQSTLPAEQKLHYILRGGTNTIYELNRGENFIWVLRFTAVMVCQAGYWKFAQMNFSFPTINFPDVRVIE